MNMTYKVLIRGAEIESKAMLVARGFTPIVTVVAGNEQAAQTRAEQTLRAEGQDETLCEWIAAGREVQLIGG